MSSPDDVIPQPLEDDDDDVAWALQTAAVQWRRGAKPDAVLWLRRAVESAMEVGHTPRAMQLNAMIAGVEERIVADVFSSPAPPVDEGSAVDGLLETTVQTGRQSIDVEFDDENEGTDIIAPADLFRGGGSSAPPPPPAMPTTPAEPEKKKRRVRPPPPPSSMPKADTAPPPPRLPRPPGAARVDVAPAVFESPTVVPEAAAPASVAPDSSPTIATTEAGILGDLPPFGTEHPATERPAPSAELDVGALLAEATAPPERAASTQPELREAAPAPADGEPRILGVSLGDVAGLQDLPPEAQVELVKSARIETLDVDEEVSAFAVALVVEGWASIMPSIADVACVFAQVGDVVFTQGTLDESVSLRVVAGETDTRIAVWDREALGQATADCPWVADELRAVADRFQALAGAAMGPLGERLDDTLRQMVTGRCEVRTLMGGEEIVATGKPVPGMYIVGAGSVELTAGEDVVGELGPGEFLFATSVMAASKAPMGARAGPGGALLLFAERHAAHELMVSVPPLLEILAG